MKKKILIVLVIILVLCIGVIGGIVIFQKKASANEIGNNLSGENGLQEEEITISQDITKDKTVDGITFTDMQCSFDGSDFILEYTITNTTGNDIHLTDYELIIKDEDGNILANIAPTLDITLKNNESYSTGNAINMDLSAAYSMEIQLGSDE